MKWKMLYDCRRGGLSPKGLHTLDRNTVTANSIYTESNCVFKSLVREIFGCVTWPTHSKQKNYHPYFKMQWKQLCILLCQQWYNGHDLSQWLRKYVVRYQNCPVQILYTKCFWCQLLCQFASEQGWQFFCLVCSWYKQWLLVSGRERSALPLDGMG